MARSFKPDENTEEAEDDSHPAGDDKSIWDEIDYIMRHVPEDALGRLPADGAEQHDHFLYGSPRKVPRTS
jgi:hypothetical protein